MDKTSIFTCFVVLLTIVIQTALAKDLLRVCYFPNWAHQRVSPLARFDIAKIDPYICTHLIYAFGNIDKINKILETPPAAEVSRYRAFNDLKKTNTQLKTLLSVGGQNDHGDGFTAVAQTEAILKNFTASTVKFLRYYGFDGIDLDWEYPNANNNQTLITILKALRQAFDSESTTSRLLLTIAAPPGRYYIDPGYQVAEINKYVDYVSVMTYDYATSDNLVTAFNSPLYSRNSVRFNQELSTNWTVHYYNQLGLDFSKILVGITGVGKWLVLQNSSVYDVGSNTTKASRKGTHYEIPGGLAYPEICIMLRNSSSTRYFDENQQVPYLVNADNWIGYEDPQSVEAKTRWMMSVGVAGLMFWSLDQDDFSGESCNQGPYPLLSKAKQISSNDTGVTTSKPAPVTIALTKDLLRVCYFPNWAHQRVSPLARFDIANVDPYICTHLIYAFGNIDKINKVLQTPPAEEVPRYKAFNDLKKKNTQLKTLLSVGGQNDQGDGFTAVAQTEATLNNFAASTVTFLRYYGFDGIDLDWEYPNANNKQILITLLKALREAFDRESTSSRLLLTIAAPPGRFYIDPGYNVADINKYVDYVNVMTYDYATSDNLVTAFNSPLYSRNSVRFNQELSTNWTVHYYNQLGLDFSKILVGITGVGKWLVLQNSSVYDVGSDTAKASRKGSHYEIPGGLAYPEICIMLRNISSTRYFDENQQVPYLVNGDNWIGYEDPQSVEAKTRWMMSVGVAGLMFWSLDQDDFSGQNCNQGRYPLLSKAKKISSNDTSVDTTVSAVNVTTSKPMTATTRKTVTAAPKSLTVKKANQGSCLHSSLTMFFLIHVILAIGTY